MKTLLGSFLSSRNGVVILWNFLQGSARQLFQRLQGPVEEETIKGHFEKIIQIGQKQYQRKIQVCYKLITLR